MKALQEQIWDVMALVMFILDLVGTYFQVFTINLYLEHQYHMHCNNFYGYVHKLTSLSSGIFWRDESFIMDGIGMIIVNEPQQM